MGTNPTLLDECERALPLLLDGAGALGLELNSTARAAFLTYCRKLAETNLRVNLTAVRTAPGIMTTLFLDALTCVLALPAELRSGERKVDVVDVGAGAGLPGLPLALVHAHWRLTLIESIGKKARFLAETAGALDLGQVRVLAERAEILGAREEFRDRADLCLARAVAALPTLVELCAPLVRPGGVMIFPKGRESESEVRAAWAAATAVGAEWDDTIPVPVELSGTSGKHVLVRFRKVRATPSRFPRRVGLARSQPVLGSREGRLPTRGNRSRPG